MQRSLRPLDSQLARGAFLRDPGPFKEVYETAFR
jgi:hypothetical protein